jgi:thiamine pyrophosphokinase
MPWYFPTPFPEKGVLFMSDRRAVLFANGIDPKKGILKFSAEDYLIAVDGGLHHLFSRGFLPDLLVGDLDSIDPNDLNKCLERGVETLRFPPEKDLTDLELALSEGVKRGFHEILIAFGLGGRVDHSLGNLALLNHPLSKDLFLHFDDGQTEVLLLNDNRFTWATRTSPGDLISLIPWQEDVTGVRSEGLKYPLHGETLFSGRTRGISNLACGEYVSVSRETGALLFIRYRQQH